MSSGREPPRIVQVMMGWAARRLGASELPDQALELFGQRRARDGAWAAHRWYARQAAAAWARALFAEARDATHDGPTNASRGERGSVAGVMALRQILFAARRIRHDLAQTASFGVIVGTGIAVTAFMAQTRASMLHPDLGLGRRVDAVEWIDSSGATRPTIAVTGSEDWIAAARGPFTALVPFRPIRRALDLPQGIVRAYGQAVPAGYLGALGVVPRLGLDVASAGDVVLSTRLWVTRFDSDPGVLGSFVTLDGSPARVVGVAPAGFDGPFCCVPPDFFLVEPPTDAPVETVLAAVETGDSASASVWLTQAAGRAAGGARASLRSAESAPYGGETGIIGRTLTVLMLLSLVTWLATLLSGANLIMSDTLARSAELRLRRALGARSTHTVMRTIAETGWLAVVAASVALLIAWSMTRLAPWLLPMIGSTSSVEVVTGHTALTTVGLAAVVATVVCALPSAVVGLRLSHTVELRRGPARSRFAAVGLGTQVALASALLVVTGIFAVSVRALDGDFVGFRHGRAAVYFISASVSGTETSASTVVADVGAVLPGSWVAVTRRLPVYGALRDSVALPDGRRISAAMEDVTPGFFETIGSRLSAGETAVTSGDVVVSEDVAAMLGGATAALGRSVLLRDTMELRVVGVVEAATWGSGDVRPTIYRGWRDEPVANGVLLFRDGRGGSGGASMGTLLAALRPHALAVEPFGTLEGLLVRSRVVTVFLMRLATLFGVLSLLIAVGGVYAYFMRWVRSRSHDLAMRAALGASTSRVGYEVGGEAVRVVVPGMLGGCLLGWVAIRAVESFLGDFGSPGVILFAGTVAVLSGTTLVALIGPIVRAGRADPLALLRVD